MKKRRKSVVDLDNPPLTDEQLEDLRPAPEVLPSDAKDVWRNRRARGRQRAPTKRAISIRIDADTLERYRSTGAGWQTRMSSDLARVSKTFATRDAAARAGRTDVVGLQIGRFATTRKRAHGKSHGLSSKRKSS